MLAKLMVFSRLLEGTIVPVQGMKVYKGSTGIALLINLAYRWTSVFNITPWPLYPLHWKLDGSQSRSRRFGEDKNLLPLARFEFWIV
jgi:hypothetical protein